MSSYYILPRLFPQEVPLKEPIRSLHNTTIFGVSNLISYSIMITAAAQDFAGIPINYDLAQGKELVLNDLFLPHSNYLEAISNYCVAELSKRNTTNDSIYGATYPIPYNYQDNWNIMPEGLMITLIKLRLPLMSWDHNR